MLALEKAQALLEAQPQVTSAWHFGSTQKGQARADSDVDLGLLLTAPLSLEQHLELIALLEEALHIERVDLALLNMASPVLQFEAICGRNIVCKDADGQAEFVSRVSREYENVMVRLEQDVSLWRQGA